MTQIGTADNLLKAKPMTLQVKEAGKEAVLNEIFASVKKCIVGLSLEMSNEAILMLCTDILEAYPYESIEDVILCLKRGRLGVYGFGHNNRRTLNMLVIREWMSLHLDKKAELREKELSKLKAKENDQLDSVDYEAFKKRMKEKKAEPKTKNDNDFFKWRLQNGY